MEYSLDQRRYRLDLSKKQLHEECNRRGRKISYQAVCTVINEPRMLSPAIENMVRDTIKELETSRGITDIDFD